MKKVLLIAAIAASANSLNAVELSGDLTKILSSPELSSNCTQCISRALTNTKLPDPLSVCGQFQQTKSPPYIQPSNSISCQTAIWQYSQAIKSLILRIPTLCSTVCKP